MRSCMSSIDKRMGPTSPRPGVSYPLAVSEPQDTAARPDSATAPAPAEREAGSPVVPAKRPSTNKPKKKAPARKKASGKKATRPKATARKPSSGGPSGGHLVIVESPTKAKTLTRYLTPVL